MAIMRSKSDTCKTDGEKLVYQFFKDNLSDEYIVWANIELLVTRGERVHEAEIDFILHHPSVGLLLFEVKDWRVEHIKTVSADWLELENGKKFKNPFVKMKHHSYTLRTKLQQYEEFLDECRRVNSPVNIGIILPFITQQDWINKLKSLSIYDPDSVKMSPAKILFKESFDDNSSLKDASRALNRFQNLRAVKFQSTFDEEQINCLNNLFGTPDTKEDLAKSMQSEEYVAVDDNTQLIRLDNEQKKLANRYLKNFTDISGHLVIKGVAGSGKTIILLHMFSQIARDPDKKILYIGRQRELVEDFRKNLNALGVYTESPQYFINTFHQFAQLKFGENYATIERDSSGYPSDKGITKYIEGNLEAFDEEYDYTFIDEGHNLPDQWVKLLVYCTKGRERGNVIYVEDFEQNIYRVKRDFKKAGIVQTGSGAELLMNYRNTWEINYFALNLTNKYTQARDVVKQTASLRRGNIPTLILSHSVDESANNIFNKFKEWLEDGFSVDDIAIIYPKADADDPDGLYLKIIETFYSKGFKFALHYAQRKIERMFPEKYHAAILPTRGTNLDHSDAINLITTFSSQGLSYKCAIVIMDNFVIDRWGEDRQSNMVYISLTRATNDLVLAFSKEDIYYKKSESVIEQMKKIKL